MRKAVFVFVLLLLFLPIIVSSIHAKKSIEITCYMSDLADNLTPGDVDVENITDAVKKCNSTYEECEEKCVGCYITKDGLEMCIDGRGKKFKKE